MNRISRVAHRLGVVLAVPLIVVAIGLVGFGLYTRLAPSAPAGMFDDLIPPENRPDPAAEQADKGNLILAYAAFAALLGTGAYGATRAVGWIINGWRDGP